MASTPTALGDWVCGRALWVAFGASLLLTFFGVHLYVDQLFVTFLHEASHGLAAMATGGELVRFTVAPDTSGLATTRGGFRPLILLAGYAGGCVWGGALLLAAMRQGWARWVLGALAVCFLFFTLLFVRNLFGFATGLAFAGFFGLVAWRGASWQTSLLLAFLAARSSLAAVVDLRDLLWHSTTPARSDASLMSQEFSASLVPAPVFALFIGLVSLLLLGAVLWFGTRGLARGAKGERAA